MSRRKQGRPQHRLTLDSVEQENDLLVCGECRTNFPLREITKFIRHKVNKCNKENVDNDTETFGREGDGDDANNTISTKRTPISAPITRKESFDSVQKSPHLLDSDLRAENEEESGDARDTKDRLPFRLKQVADADTNTTNSEPLKFICETCRKLFNSAWTLLQHCQKEHGMRIYVPSSKEQYTPNHSPRISTPNSQKSKKSDDLVNELDKSKDDRHDDISGKDRVRSDSTEPLRTTSSVGSASSGEGPLSGHPSPHNPFMFPRMPFVDARHPLSPISGLGHLGRLTGDLRLSFSDDPYHRSLFGPPGFEHRPTAPYNPFDQRPSRPGMSLDDFYSQRLRQLASSTSPSPARKHTPPFSGSGGRSPGMFSSITPPGTSNPPSDQAEKSGDNTRSLTPPGNQKSCEFCGKTFRFQSNLIVHRRSHTGEKPFKCPVCPHACTQQSKLKRHMKTHSKPGGMGMSSNLSEGSQASNSSTPDSNKMNDDDEEDAYDEDEEEEEEEEEEDMEMLGMEEMNSQRTDDRKDYNKHSGKSELAARLFDQRIEATITNELIKDSEQKERKGTLLSEVMENSGLKSIPIYNESLQLAMAEKYSPHESRPRSSSNNDSSRPSSARSQDPDDKERGMKRDKPSDDSIMSISKMIKREPHDKIGTPPVSSSPRINNVMEPAFFPSLWFPGPPDFFTGRFPLPRYGVNEGNQDQMPNGVSMSTPNDMPHHISTSQSNNSSPTTPLPTNGSTPAATPRKDRNRNDTCEFCGKVFKNCSNLTVHRRSHTGEKPYKCMLCSYACAQSSKLTRHMKTHGRFGKDVYKCKFCGMPFSVPSTLEKHMRKCVENTNKGSLPENEDTNGSVSDTASASDSQSVPLTTMSSMSLPTTPMSMSTAFGLGMPFSLQSSFKDLNRYTEMENDNSGTNGDRLSTSGTPTSFSASNNNSLLDGPNAGLNSDKVSQSSSISTSGLSFSTPLSLASGLGIHSSSLLDRLKMENMRREESGLPPATSPSLSFQNSPLQSLQNSNLLNSMKRDKMDKVQVENVSSI